MKQPLKLAEFKPALAINPDILARYEANRLRVVRQVRYSQHNENSIDLVLFLNGLPVATAELKTDFTQSIDDAIDQYRFDRLPRPKGQAPEPLLSFPHGALVHFAVSNGEVHMVTRLDGPATVFLPFNQGDEGAAGNPVNPKGGHRTAYLWEQVWERESWLEIIGRYLIAQRDKKKQIEKIIFPRFHQLDVTRKLQAAVLAEGAGGKYLVQHSAGSGKTNSIAWTAHFLAELHDAQHKKVFDTVLVVSDRNVIDSQLQEALFDFQRTTGVVATITNQEGSKSGKLAEALSGDKKIVVCTIQTFPFALEAVRELAATQGKRFAVIADEAHSSQTGEAAAKLKAVLSPEELKEVEDGDEVSSEDVLAAQMAARAEDERHGLLAEILQVVMRQYDLGNVDAFALPAEFQQRQQALVEDRPLLDVRVAVVEDLRQERVEPQERTHVRLEQDQRIQLVLRILSSLFLLLLRRDLQRLAGRLVALDHAILHWRQGGDEIALF